MEDRLHCLLWSERGTYSTKILFFVLLLGMNLVFLFSLYLSYPFYLCHFNNERSMAGQNFGEFFCKTLKMMMQILRSISHWLEVGIYVCIYLVLLQLQGI